MAITVPQLPKQGQPRSLLSEILPMAVYGYIRGQESLAAKKETEAQNQEAYQGVTDWLNPKIQTQVPAEGAAAPVPMASAQPTPATDTSSFPQLTAFLKKMSGEQAPTTPETAQTAPPLKPAPETAAPAPTGEAGWLPGPEAAAGPEVSIPKGLRAQDYASMALNQMANTGSVTGKPAATQLVSTVDEKGNPIQTFVPKQAGGTYAKYVPPTIMSVFVNGQHAKGITDPAQISDNWKQQLIDIRKSLPINFQTLNIPGLVMDRGTGHVYDVGDLNTPLSGDQVRSQMLALEEQKPVTSVKNMQQSAVQLLPLIGDVRQDLQTVKNQLGPIAGRLNDFYQGKIGANDPDYEKLRLSSEFVSTLVMKMHVGLQRSTTLYEAFKKNYDPTKQSFDNIQAALDATERYANQLARPKFSGAKGQPAVPGNPTGVPGAGGGVPTRLPGETPQEYLDRMTAAGF